MIGLSANLEKFTAPVSQELHQGWLLTPDEDPQHNASSSAGWEAGMVWL